jgi:D-amino-acid oxidase
MLPLSAVESSALPRARLLQDRGFDAAIYAAELPPHTTSDVAAGAFGVTSLVDDQHHVPEIAGLVQEAVGYAHKYFATLIGGR